jgi:hypothetical protein
MTATNLLFALTAFLCPFAADAQFAKVDFRAHTERPARRAPSRRSSRFSLGNRSAANGQSRSLEFVKRHS